MKKSVLISLAAAAALSASAHTVLLSENFDSDFSENFPVMIEGDHLAPVSNINSLFMDSNGTSRPWNTGRDGSGVKDRFIMSHSCYQRDGASKDFLVSKAITIPSTGFNLTFGAQSVRFIGGERLLSDLHVFVLEQLPTEATLPTAEQADLVCEAVPTGADPDLTAGEFTSYTLNLDKWQGKTVYIAFANLNYKKDILALDNVLVQRLDNAELNVEAPEYIVAGRLPIKVNLKSTSTENLGPWTLTVKCGNFTNTETGSSIEPGDDFEWTFITDIAGGVSETWQVTATIEGQAPLSATGTTTGMLFEPTRRVLMEETTGTWCGNCPMGIYTMEEIAKDEYLSEHVVPVAVHIHDSSRSEPMVCEEYANAMGQTAAPLFYINRTSNLLGFAPAYDLEFDPENTNSAAHALLEASKELTLMNLTIDDIRYKYVEGTRDLDISVLTSITPAVNLDGSRYSLGYIITEDNVGIDFNANPTAYMAYLTGWIQHNYISGNTCESRANGWADLSRSVRGVYFQHVARAIEGFWGVEGTVPAQTLKAGQSYTHWHSVDVPDTYTEREYTGSQADLKGTTFMVTPAVNINNVNVVAFLIDNETGEVVNAAERSFAPETREKRDTAWLLNYTNAIETIETIETPAILGPAEYFTIDGLRVSEPAKGQLYIVRQGSKVSKVIF